MAGIQENKRKPSSPNLNISNLLGTHDGISHGALSFATEFGFVGDRRPSGTVPDNHQGVPITRKGLMSDIAFVDDTTKRQPNTQGTIDRSQSSAHALVTHNGETRDIYIPQGSPTGYAETVFPDGDTAYIKQD